MCVCVCVLLISRATVFPKHVFTQLPVGLRCAHVLHACSNVLDELVHCLELRELSLIRPSVAVHVASLANLTRLTTLRLSYCLVRKADALPSLPNLRFVDLEGSTFPDGQSAFHIGRGYQTFGDLEVPPRLTALPTVLYERRSKHE